MNGQMDRQRFNILLVEDNEADVYLVRKAMQMAQLEFDLTVIHSGVEALRYIDGVSRKAIPLPDIALLDLNIPTNSGIEVLAALRATRALARIPVIVVTSSSSQVDRARTEALNISKYIIKPAELAEFAAVGADIKAILLADEPS